MENGISLDRVQMNGTRISVDKGEKSPLPIFTDPAVSPFSLRYDALFGAQITPNTATTQWREVWGKLRLDEAFPDHLCMEAFGKTGERREAKGTQTGTAKSQEIPFRQG